MRRLMIAAVAMTVLAGGAAAAEEPPTDEPPPDAGTVVLDTTTTLVGLPADAVTATTLAETAALASAASEVGTGERCAEASNRSLSGTLKGADGRFVNAIISVVLTTADTTQRLGMDGCAAPPSGYATQLHLNTNVGAEGAASGVEDWRIDNLPANATQFTFEVYPWDTSPSRATWSPYGGVSKRRIQVGAGVANISLRLPLVCGQPGGTTGSILVRNFVDGVDAGHITNALALSEDTSRTGVQGFRSAEVDPPPASSLVLLDALAPNQRYSGVLQSSGQARYFSGIGVRTCQETPVWVWSGTHPPARPPRWSPLAASVHGVYFAISGDFNGDGADDIFWYAPSGTDHLWLSTGSGNGFNDRVVRRGGGFRPVAGDFNADGIDDIFWYRPGAGADRLWIFTPTGGHQGYAAVAGGPSNTWPVAGDFDGNGYDDILFYSPGTTSTLWRVNAGGHTTRSVTAGSGYSVRAGDINGDNRDDLIWHNAATGTVRLWFGRRTGSFLARTDTTGIAPYQTVLGDFSGDLRADVIWYLPGSGADRYWGGRASSSPYFAKEGGDLHIDGAFNPIVGDWNGDGTDDIFWYGPGNNTDAIWRSNMIAWNIYPAP